MAIKQVHKFELISDFKPKGGQPEAIRRLVDGYYKYPKQTLLGITGSGKTFVMAHVINQIQKPTLVLAHNKTLAAQLWYELKTLFPKNRVEYFVSYYDYYQPESYLPATDTYIEKDSEVNEKIEQLRLRATASLLSRSDTIIVSSVSCIYGLGSPENFEGMAVELSVGQKIRRDEILKKLVDIQYNRNDDNLVAGNFRVRGDIIDVVLGYSGEVIRISMFGDVIESINYLDPFNNKVLDRLELAMIFPARHFVIPESEIQRAIDSIREELSERLPQLEQLFSYRLKQRTNYDLELIEQLGYCKGIENYSRHFDGRNPGEPPFCLLDFFPKEFLLIIDESHQTIPQTHGMYKGDYTRKKALIDYGFRLESAYDNRPLKWEEFSKYLNHTIFVSATPGDYEIKESGQIVELIIRPTGLVDPEITVKKTQGQMDDLISEIKKTVSRGFRVLVTTLTKRMAEDLTNYLLQRGIRVRYLHSEIETIERTEIIRSLRLKEFDVLVGINLLREGIDIPEVALVAILDADKEGFLRNTKSLIQTIGRAARNEEGRVIMYADSMTDSMKEAIEITHTRRKKQIEYNKENNIIPKTIIKPIQEAQVAVKAKEVEKVSLEEIPVMLAQLDSEMRIAAEKLEFERAIEIRERIKKLEGRLRPR